MSEDCKAETAWREDPYFIEVDTNGCAHCGARRTWTIVGPDDVAIGRSFEDEESASDLAEDMNRAYWQGVEAALKLWVTK